MSQNVDDSAALLAALDRGESLPSHWYTDPSITAREIELIFRKSWNYVGSTKALQKVGDYITGHAGEVPIVVIRNEHGLSALVNVCRHRRHEVMKGRGNCSMMQCGYHAWTYDLTGSLKRAPRSAAERNFRLEDYPLLPIQVDTLGPFVFVNIDRSAPPVASYFGKVLDVIAGCGINLDTLELYQREEWHSDANWKTMLENYLECYHCAIAHPGFSAAIDVLPENYHLTPHGWFLSQVGQVRESALQGKSAVKIYDARGGLEQSQFHVLWPNLTININPGFTNLSVDVWMPDGPNHTKGFSEQYFGPGVTEEFAQELIAFNKQVGIEDDDLTNSVQNGLLAGIPDRGRFLINSENLALQFQKLVVNALSKQPAAARQVVATQAAPVGSMISVTPDDSLVPDAERNASFELEVAKVERESSAISSFYLRRVDHNNLTPWEPGQFLPIRVKIPGHAEPVLRTYTLSTCANPDFYRLSIRRMDPGLVSSFLHDNAKPGFRIDAMTPRGKFFLDQSTERPVVLLSGGVGLTPMIAITEHIVAEGKRTGKFRPLHFIHGTHNGEVHAFGNHIKELASQHPAMKVHYRYSKPTDQDKLGVTHDANGQVTIDVLRSLLAFDDYDFYLCGPPPFMASLYTGLIGIGVKPERIHYESFGPGTVLKPEITPHVTQPGGSAAGGVARVRFARSGQDAVWEPGKGTLLELAEAAGLAPAFGCRSGICGTCKTKVRDGAVDYLEEPLADRGSDEVLLCCSTPRQARGHQQDSHEPDLTLDL
jgi:ferredoxin-NADP reductase/phenylpropionate dioxygenase-like ring-hydroxylating dioxygenase large terminal subunit